MNESNQERERGETPPQSLRIDSATPKQRVSTGPIVGWRDRIYERLTRCLSCPNCGNDRRVDLELAYREYEGTSMLYYKCKQCHCQFTRRPRFEDIYDTKGRI